ncbi:MAG: hypothetical protein GY954_12550, partial [Alteromonas sp.]|nr:hypothetical protein [Alteromonas sp.]
TEEANARTQTDLQEQNALLLKAKPTWSDEGVREKEAAAIAEHLIQRGFTQDEVARIQDHRILLMAADAMQSKKVANTIDLAKKKVKKAPRLVKPNARQNANQAHKKAADLTSKARKTGRVDDVAQALLARG